jgi:hypothetical protein
MTNDQKILIDLIRATTTTMKEVHSKMVPLLVCHDDLKKHMMLKSWERGRLIDAIEWDNIADELEKMWSK